MLVTRGLFEPALSILFNPPELSSSLLITFKLDSETHKERLLRSETFFKPENVRLGSLSSKYCEKCLNSSGPCVCILLSSIESSTQLETLCRRSSFILSKVPSCGRSRDGKKSFATDAASFSNAIVLRATNMSGRQHLKYNESLSIAIGYGPEGIAGSHMYSSIK